MVFRPYAERWAAAIAVRDTRRLSHSRLRFGNDEILAE